RADAKANAARKILPARAATSHVWISVSALRAQQRIYAENYSMASSVSNVLWYGGLGRSAAAVGGSSGVKSLSAFGGVRGGLAGIGATLLSAWLNSEAQIYKSYVDGIQARIDYIQDCTTLGG